MPEYLWPSLTPGVSDTYWDHRNRTPPSVNPGTDITCAYGSNVFATRSGRVSGMSRTTNGSGGRYVQVSNDNGTRSQYLHLSQILVNVGDWVSQGQVIAISGASGFGSDWGYGPHLHKSLAINGNNVDFQLYSSPTGSRPAGGNSTPIPELTPEEQENAYLMAVADDIVADIKARILESEGRQMNVIRDGFAAVMRELSNDDAQTDRVVAEIQRSIEATQRENRARLFRNTDTGELIAIGGDKFEHGYEWIDHTVPDGGRGKIDSLRDKEAVGDKLEQARPLNEERFSSFLVDAGIPRDPNAPPARGVVLPALPAA